MTGIFLAQALLPHGWARDVRVTHNGGRIVTVETGATAQPGDARHAIGIPGLPNLHSHGFQRGLAGLGERRGTTADDFWTWRDVMYRFLDSMTPEDIEAITAQAYVEMVESGFTRVGEFHYLHNDTVGAAYADPAELTHRIVSAAKQAGLRLTLLPVFYAHGGFGGMAPTQGQRRFVMKLDRFAGLLEASHAAVAPLNGGVVGIAPHSLRAVTPDQLIALCDMANGRPIHIHIAEQMREVEDCLRWSGARPVEWLLDHAPVGRNWCLIHATHMGTRETTDLAATGAVAGLCPVTEANLGDGIFNGADWLAAGGPYGVGTDSNVAISAALELQMLEVSQRLGRRARNVMAGAAERSTGRSLFDTALAGGAAALGAGASGITPGAGADLVALDPDHPSLLRKTNDAILDSWIFGTARPAVDAVWVAGRQYVIGGRHIARDAVAARFGQVMRRLLTS